MEMSITDKIKGSIHTIGFSKLGITKPNQLESDRVNLKNWFDNGYHASMAWIERRKEERVNLLSYFPEVKSVISIAVNYFPQQAPDSNDIGKISNYAWGEDYHSILKRKLFELLALVQQDYPDVLYRVCVDTSPVMDKIWARQAGLGWIGKHTNIITRDFGSWVFLGELMLDIELDYDPPFEADHCGTCTACLDACPTDAFPSPYVLDANKCISYLTIEHRGSIASELETEMGDWIYGCDICQQVCPWNIKLQKITNEEGFLPRHDIHNTDLKQWGDLTPEEFKKLFKGSPVKRTKFEGLKRNIDIAIKNVKSQ
ncbi:MAG: tRNA epoxyqueuosine(34) reductase QueG [Candidatus Marinimicrobia bacterium]|jgi:epoxyqueuosine reductase|nr:tRNA epoxyqueuosine(34) reductase QueG [Candidatus Neomarinimicrobiota bacterium]MBT3635070.1 tRNA epoxyqueuosine(34) reductase QueG [Candidatus Neomarinimicrobiota bacterium]MBT3683124.1 tRNA epoxyqueuosine(34) reductase QueG [Candidatus Neomarinimicrobiota bacterium]MBT3760730.1 tRNA epoxyqueuosine(34) reductase QueG [Candidatus Neomarinimicrobiota bacterium]MBT3896814.1 tRNA epoxyqueuosine(34) reductase QueG [Candidatus Neomarinimicrobiota bacterium]